MLRNSRQIAVKWGYVGGSDSIPTPLGCRGLRMPRLSLSKMLTLKEKVASLDRYSNSITFRDMVTRPTASLFPRHGDEQPVDEHEYRGCGLWSNWQHVVISENRRRLYCWDWWRWSGITAISCESYRFSPLAGLLKVMLQCWRGLAESCQKQVGTRRFLSNTE